jgi:hypothetical protein
LIGARPYFEFTPSNPWIAVGWRTTAATRVTMQGPIENKGVEWLVNTVTRIDGEQSKLTLDDGKELNYDYMIESMVSATAANIVAELAGKPAAAEATWNAICLADFGDTGAAFVALPQIPPRNVTWSKKGKWVHLAKIAFAKYFLRKVRTGSLTPVYETYVLKALGVVSLKQRAS